MLDELIQHPQLIKMQEIIVNLHSFTTHYLLHNHSKVLRNSALLEKILFHTFRHLKATMEYHRTKDILHVKQLLGHRNINSTLLNTQLVNFESDDFHVRVTKTLKETRELAKAGFEHFTKIDGVQVFRKRK